MYLYGFHRVFVPANAVDEIRLGQPMAVQRLLQLFLRGRTQIQSEHEDVGSRRGCGLLKSNTQSSSDRVLSSLPHTEQFG